MELHSPLHSTPSMSKKLISRQNFQDTITLFTPYFSGENMHGQVITVRAAKLWMKSGKKPQMQFKSTINYTKTHNYIVYADFD